ncbi:MAG TPA: nitrate- and nitrite sensing domain-containing protein [Actinospica sp.]|nr:nitrate- and nitrite sensing domain-containing protein [Actinospica sp.]
MQTRPVTPRRESAQSGARSSGVNTAASERRRGIRPPGQPPVPGNSAGAERPGRFSIRSWRVRNRLFLLVCFPLIIAIGVAATRVNTLFQDRTHYANVKFQANTVATVETLVLALQDERQAAALCLATSNGGPCTSGNANYGDYTYAINNTNVVRDNLRASASAVATGSSYAAGLREATVEAVGRVDDLPSIEKVVTTSSAPYTTTYNAYTDMISDVIHVVANAASGASDISLTQDQQALTAITAMVEAEAEAAAITGQVIHDDGPLGPAIVQTAQANTLETALAAYTSSQNQFESVAAPSLVQSFNATVSGPEVAGSSAGNAAALAVLQSSNTNAAVAANQLNLSTSVADEDLPTTLGNLRAVQAATIAQMQNDTQSLLNNADNDLYLNIGVIIVALLLSFVGTIFVARSLTGPLSLLRAAALDIASTRLPEMVRRLRDADAATADANSRVEPIPISSSDEIGEVARSFDEVHQQAVRLASEQAMLRANVNSMFVNLSRRSQSLVQRQLRLIDELENSEQDPDQLANLFKLDHLATRMRRNGENLLVLAGEEPGRKWSQAVRLLDVLRAGASEVEQYERVQLQGLPDTNVVGRVVNDLVHLVAELLENATSFSAPETRVTVTANTLNTGGVMLEIEDSGIGMTPEELDDANERLANPPVIDVAISRRMGLYVVGRLATRHGIQVRLRRSAGGGITALVLVPSSLLAGIENEQAPVTELSATGVRNLGGVLPRRGAIGSEGFPAFAEQQDATGPQPHPQPTGLGSLSGLGVGGGQQDAPAPERALGQGIPSARTPLDEQTDLTLPTPPVGPPVNPFAGGAREEGPSTPLPFSQEPPSLPAAPFGAEGLPGLPGLPQQGGANPFAGEPRGHGGPFVPEQAPEAPAAPRPPAAPGNPFRAAPRNELNLGAPAPQQFQQLPPQAEPQLPLPTAPQPEPERSPAEPPPAPPARAAETTGQLPRIRDVGNTGQFPAVRNPAQPPAPAPQAAPAPAPQQLRQPPALPTPPPAVLPQRASDDTGEFRLGRRGQGGQQGADELSGSGEFTVAERLFAADPLPPAPTTDERLPIFEAMESEWFRRRDEARAAAQNLRAGVEAPAPAPVPLAAPAAPRVELEAPAPAPAPLEEPQVELPTPPSLGTTTPDATSTTQPTPSAPATAAPTSAGETPMESPLPGRQPAQDVPSPQPAGAGSAAWSSPGDEGWRAAQAAAKPVAAGLTQKGLPKRVPKSNLVPGSAGGTGAAKATPPAMPARSAEEVRGKLSSFHRGLRQGRDAATGQGGEQTPEGEK